MSVQTFRKNCDGSIHAAVKKEYMAKKPAILLLAAFGMTDNKE
jgi:hypothetical protein